MKANRLRWFLIFFLGSSVFQMSAQQSQADRKPLADIRAKAKGGDTQSQYELGRAFAGGSLGLAKDEAEAVGWYRKAAERGDVNAQFALGVCYGNAVGV